MQVKCRDCPLRKLSLFDEMTEDEVAFQQSFKSGEMSVAPHTTVLMEGSKAPQLFTVLNGMGLRYKTLPDGRRQVISFVMPGDFLGLQGAIQAEMGHGVEATTKMRLCVFRRSDIWTLFKNHPERAYDLTWLASTEEHFLGESLATVGQRSAMEKIAWAMVLLIQRGRALGLVNGTRMRFPFRQQDLADSLGLSLVHTNKTLAKLRERKLVSWIDGVINVQDIEQLSQIALIDREGWTRARPLM